MDFFYRCGSDEFVVLPPGLPAERTRGLIQRLVTSINQMLPSAVKCQSPCARSISLGSVSMQPQPQQSPAASVEQADKKLYLAKQNGHDQIQYE